MKNQILEAYHDNMMTGHLGSTRTICRINKRFYWPKMEEEVRQYVRACLSCQMRKDVPAKPAGFMMFFEVEYPYHRVGIDVLGPFPGTEKNNKYIIVAIDYLTKWAETGSLQMATAADIAQFFVNRIVLRHGAPQAIISDRGKGFIAELMQETLEIVKTKHLRTTSYHPQTNGLCERLNHTLSDMLSMYVNADHKNWDEILPYVTFAYNTSKQESTKYSPFYLLYGREAVFPLDVALKVNPNPYEHTEKDYGVFVAERITEAREVVVQNLRKVHL